jgi:hypothetical protein
LRPIIWGEKTKEQLKNAITKVNPEITSADIDALQPDDAIEELKSIIAKGGKTLQLENQSQYIIGQELCKRLKGAKKIVTKSIIETLLTYHNTSLPPKIIEFVNAKYYSDFFKSNTPGVRQVARDLFAVRDIVEKKWCLCIGANFSHYSSPNMVELQYTSSYREMGTDTLFNEKLDKLFQIDGKQIDGVNYHEINEYSPACSCSKTALQTTTQVVKEK